MKELDLADAMPVYFIVGPHRAGTTYLQTLIGSMPAVGTCQETHFFCRVLPYLKELQDVVKREVSFSDVKNAIIKIMFLGEDIVDFWDDCEAAFLSGGYSRLLKYLMFNLATKNNDEVNVLLEKTPSHLMHIKEISEVFPKAKFIIIVRDPRAIAASFLKYLPHLGQEDRYSYLLKEVRYLNSFFRVISTIKQKSSNNIKIVKYENVVHDEKSELNDLCSFLGIDFAENYKEKHFELAAKIVLAGDIHKKMNKENIEKVDLNSWREKLSRKERFILDIFLHDILLQFNYMPIYRVKGVLLQVLKNSLNLWSRKIPPFCFPGTNKNDSLIDKYIPWSPSCPIVAKVE
jgi:hypothetical protein